MSAGSGAGRASTALSLGVLLLLLMAWTVPAPQAPEDPSTPAESEPAPAPDPEPVRAERPVVLPPPPAIAQRAAPERPARTPAPGNAARKSQQAAKRVITPLRVAPQAPAPSKRAPTESVPARTAKTIIPLRTEEAAPASARQASPPTPEPRQPAPQPSPRAANPPAPDPAPAADVVEASAEVVREGRTRLRLLEHGSGPEIELAWPDSADRRARLYRHFSRCFDMRVALMDGRDRLYIADGQAGLPWDPNLDRYSGFIRRPAGQLARGEAEAAARIRAHHGRLGPARTVRVFPRRLDALLLGGLGRIVGPSYAEHGTIRARYRLEAGRLIVERIEAGGRALPGRIDLSRAMRPACRRVAS